MQKVLLSPLAWEFLSRIAWGIHPDVLLYTELGMFRGFSLLFLLCTISHLPKAKNPPTNIEVHLYNRCFCTLQCTVFFDFEDFRENIKDSGEKVQIVERKKYIYQCTAWRPIFCKCIQYIWTYQQFKLLHPTSNNKQRKMFFLIFFPYLPNRLESF